MSIDNLGPALEHIEGLDQLGVALIRGRGLDPLPWTKPSRLMARWKIGDADLPALKGLVDSQVDLSLKRLLAAD